MICPYCGSSMVEMEDEDGYDWYCPNCDELWSKEWLE